MKNQAKAFKARIVQSKAKDKELSAQKKLVAEKIKIIDKYLASDENIESTMGFEAWCIENGVDYSLFKEVENFKPKGDDDAIDLYVDTLEDLYEALADEKDNEEEHSELLEQEYDEAQSISDDQLSADGEADFQWLEARGGRRKKRKDKRKAKKDKRKAKKTARKTKKTTRKQARKDIKTARREKRQDKKEQKKELRDKYGKGSDYRKSKKEMKQELKDKKREEITKQKGIIDKNRTKFGKGLNKGSRFLKKVAASAPRNAFLAVLKINLMGVASRLRVTKDKKLSAWTNFLRKWKKAGGSEKSLIKAVDKGAKHKPKLVSKKIKEEIKKAKANSFDGFDYEWNNVVDPGTATVITAAMAFIVSALASIKGDKEAVEETEGMDTGDDEDMTDAANDQAIEGVMDDPNLTDEQKQEIVDKINAGVDPLTAVGDVTGETAGGGVTKYFIWGGIGVVGLVATVLIVKAIKGKKKK